MKIFNEWKVNIFNQKKKRNCCLTMESQEELYLGTVYVLLF